MRSSVLIDFIYFSKNKKVHSYLYSFIPFALLTVTNLLLIINLKKKSTVSVQNSQLSKNQASINMSVIMLTFLFIVFTCPSAIASQYYNVLVMTFGGNVFLSTAGCLAFTYHALNIIILCLSNKEFMRKIIKLFCKKNRVHTASSNSTNLFFL